MNHETTIDSVLWRRAFLPVDSASPADNGHRQRLNVAFDQFRDRAGLLATEIAKDLPDFTNHDLKHIDALWELADLIAGDDFQLNPLEAFVLGGAFFLHDLGLAVAAYPDGLEELRQDDYWRDQVILLLRNKLDEQPTPEECANVDEETKRAADRATLRHRHAKRAEKLARISWRCPSTGETLFLLQDKTLRDAYGDIMGRIAHSHWWSLDDVRQAFGSGKIIGAPAGYPRTWTVEPLVLACLLRVADAAHLDARRAPGFLRAVRKPTTAADNHWAFQEKLHQPIFQEGRLRFSSPPFPQSQSEAWWLCFDALNVVDRELRGVDDLLVDLKNRRRFRAVGVFGAESPERLTEAVLCDGWFPVDARIHISNVAKVVANLGGQKLYGDDQTVPLRELIQNASDAVRARRVLEKREDNWGSIHVHLGKDDQGRHWLQVEDNGVGMTRTVLTKHLLNFGDSTWRSDDISDLFPGLLAKGFQSTGQFGIGFFSIFMWGERVEVITRPYRAAMDATEVLEFPHGLASRPLLRAARDSEQMREGGTRVRVWLDRDPEKEGGLLFFKSKKFLTTDSYFWKLPQLCAWLAPALDVNLCVSDLITEKKSIVEAGDWIELPGDELLKRLMTPLELSDYSRFVAYKGKELISLTDLGEMLQIIRAQGSKTVLGRLAILPHDAVLNTIHGTITIGGLRGKTEPGIVGIHSGKPTSISRNGCTPTINHGSLSEWASDQARLWTTQNPPSLFQEKLFYHTVSCAGNPGDMYCITQKNEPKNIKMIEHQAEKTNRTIIINRDIYNRLTEYLSDFQPIDSVFVADNWLYSEFYYRASLLAKEKDKKSGMNTFFSANPPMEFPYTSIKEIIVAFARGWKVPVDTVWQAAEFSTDKKRVIREIGKVGDRSITAEVIVLNRPKP